MSAVAAIPTLEVTQHGEPPAFCHKHTLSCWGEVSPPPDMPPSTPPLARVQIGVLACKLFTITNVLRVDGADQEACASLLL